MNRIAIIGNGFDIAHGLKTKYQHFLDYLKYDYVQFIQKDVDSSSINEHTFFCLRPTVSSGKAGKTDKRYICQSNVGLNTWEDIERMIIVEYREVSEWGTGYDKDYKPKIKFKNALLQSSFEKYAETTWGGIENDYKDALVKILTKQSEGTSHNQVIALNSNLKDIVDALVKYLDTLDFPTKFHENIALKLYTRPLLEWRGNRDDVKRLGIPRVKSKKSRDDQLANILFLNFNYTPTIENYLINSTNQGSRLKEHISNTWISNDIHTSVRYIHGDLRAISSNPIIFGYGDEQDEHQLVLEKMNNEFFRYIKSVQYTRTAYYREMIDFADSEEFDIVIYGHSCSNTDRTLLNTLFEHKNCVSIQPYLFDISDNSIYNNIYRCFKDKKIMRSRVVDQTNTISS